MQDREGRGVGAVSADVDILNIIRSIRRPWRF